MVHQLVLITILLTLNSCCNRRQLLSERQTASISQAISACIDTTIWSLSIRDTLFAPSFKHTDSLCSVQGDFNAFFPKQPLVRHAKIQAQRVQHTHAASSQSVAQTSQKKPTQVSDWSTSAKLFAIIILIVCFFITLTCIHRL